MNESPNLQVRNIEDVPGTDGRLDVYDGDRLVAVAETVVVDGEVVREDEEYYNARYKVVNDRGNVVVVIYPEVLDINEFE